MSLLKSGRVATGYRRCGKKREEYHLAGKIVIDAGERA
jgi:hypothetical protein